MSSNVTFAGKGINGLANVSNSCYINTCIQCLGHCTSFLDFILHGNYTGKRGDLIFELKDVFNELWINDNGIIPNRFLKYVKENINEINILEQNDIQEFFTLLIDKINRSISKCIDIEKTMESTTYSDTLYDKIRKKVDKGWLQSVGKEYSPIVDFFYGQSVVQIVCGHCQKIHHTYEPFSLLLLPIQEGMCQLEDCINHYMKEEYLNDHGNDECPKWKCDNCHNSVKSVKTTKFWRLPKVLTICLKRFTYDLRKNNTFVSIPEVLDISPHMLSNTNSRYELKSKACHIGSFSMGHYFALCKNPNGEWYKIDDTNIAKCDDYLQTPHSYMAFYTLVE